MNILDISNLKLQFPKSVSFKKKEEAPEISVELFPINHSSGFSQHSEQQQTNEPPSIHESHESDSLLLDQGLEFPEGGLKAYLVVFGSFMGLIPAFGFMNAIGAIETYVSTHQLANVSSSTVSWIFSIYSFVAFAGGIFSGAFFDRNGAFPPLLIGTIFFCGGLFATASANTVYQFVLGFGVVGGFGNGMLMSPLIGVVSHYFSKKRATYTSIASMGGSVGGICFPLLLKKLYTEVGFSWALRILSFICLFLLSISILLSKGRLERTHEKVTSTKEFFKVYVLDIFDINSFKDFKFVFCSLGCTFAETTLVVVLTYFPSYAVSKGFDESNAYLLITVINATGVAGRYIPSYLADKWVGRFNVVIITLFMNCVICLVMWLPFGDNLKVLYGFAALYGFATGSMQSMVPVCAGQISKTSEFGRRYSTMYMFVSFGMLGCIPAGGAIIGNGNSKNYDNFIIYVSMLALLASVCYVISRYLCIGMKMKKF